MSIDDDSVTTTDYDLRVLFSERVLGWVQVEPGLWRLPNGLHQVDPVDPFRYEADAWAGVDAHPDEWIYDVDGSCTVDAFTGRFLVEVQIWERLTSRLLGTATDPDRRRALVLCCLRAVGEDV